MAKQFVDFYYKTFDRDRKGLAALYVRKILNIPQRPNSMLTFETASTYGVEAIVEKLVSLPFQKIVHRISTFDPQPSSDNGNILVLVTGEMGVDDGEHPMRYSQVFQLVPDGGSYYVLNDVFRIIYG
ncbi:MAG: Nuclear transport factor 2 [Vezdaea acicularis]|nr:MAG: Nuclear transport factor 2 [Vezdaea acicularis]